ncbi:hypothetical protein A7R75_09955 [Mycolicibacterium llatzerense]|nr:hypothetical protein [Mycolicibacterium llatzerense]
MLWATAVRTLVAVLGCALFGAACAHPTQGVSVATPKPQDVWQLAEQMVARTPLTADKFAELLGTDLQPDKSNPVRLNGGPVQLSPTLQVSSSVIAINDGQWLFASVDVDPNPCITTDMVRARYPAAEQTHAPTGHSAYEEFVWSVSYGWGSLNFGIREKEQCLTGISVERAGT